jgi:signal recognition particle receptor subunit beta
MGRSVVGTPIFDELRDLFERSQGRPGTDLRGKVQANFAEAGRPPLMIVVAGGRGVGKTTFVGSVSDTDSVSAEADTDFGQIVLRPGLVLYLFGTSQPPPSGFGGVLGAVVLVDARRIGDAFATISYFETSDVPFIVAINMFDGELVYELGEVREALALSPAVPLTTCDVRDSASTARVLQELVSYTINVDAWRPPSSPEPPA